MTWKIQGRKPINDDPPTTRCVLCTRNRPPCKQGKQIHIFAIQCAPFFNSNIIAFLELRPFIHSAPQIRKLAGGSSTHETLFRRLVCGTNQGIARRFGDFTSSISKCVTFLTSATVSTESEAMSRQLLIQSYSLDSY